MAVDGAFLISINLYDIFWLFVLSILVYTVWQHANVSRIARYLAGRHCQQEGVQLLDQNVVLKRISFARSTHALLALRRCYSFEFSSVGDFRYRGMVTLVGSRLEGVQLEPFKV